MNFLRKWGPFLFVTLGLAGCGSQGAGPQDARIPLEIGVLICAQQPGHESAIQLGFQRALASDPRFEGLFQVIFTWGNDRGQPEEGVLVLEKLVKQNSCEVVFSFSQTPVVQALTRWSQKIHVPLVFPLDGYPAGGGGPEFGFWGQTQDQVALRVAQELGPGSQVQGLYRWGYPGAEEFFTALARSSEGPLRKPRALIFGEEDPVPVLGEFQRQGIQEILVYVLPGDGDQLQKACEVLNYRPRWRSPEVVHLWRPDSLKESLDLEARAFDSFKTYLTHRVDRLDS